MTEKHAEETSPPLDFEGSNMRDASHHPKLRSLSQFFGEKLGTADGAIGHVKDFYFDDEHWAVRYVVADTGNWLPGRQVLLSPHAFGSLYQDGDSLLVDLTLKQIENSPSIEMHKPVSRQFEEDYYAYYDWPLYWTGAGMWGMGGFPMAPPPHLVPIREESQIGRPLTPGEPHLRSAKAITGYQIQTREGAIGHVTDFMMDDKSWAIRHLVIETGHWFSGKEIVLSPRHVERVSYDESKIFVNVSKDTIRDAPEYQMPELVYHDTRNFD